MAEQRKKAGLDAVLQSLQKTQKINVLDKSRQDWGAFKKTDAQVGDACHQLFVRAGECNVAWQLPHRGCVAVLGGSGHAHGSTAHCAQLAFRCCGRQQLCYH